MKHPFLLARTAINRLQDALNFDGWPIPHFKEPASPGRVGVAAFVLGLLCGMHIILALACVFIEAKISAVFLQWSTYFSLLCVFHFMEFLITALRQPRSNVL
jgi:hypothetical protein